MDEREYLEQLRGLRDEIEPARDLWPGIAARIAPRRAWLQIAAAIVLFAAGLGCGLLVRRSSSPSVREDAATAIQREGTEYVAAVSALARERDPRAQLEGREVALSTIYGALAELQRSTGEEVPGALRAVGDRRERVSRDAQRVAFVRF